MVSGGDVLPRFFTVFLSQYSSESLLIPSSYYEHLPRRLPKTSILMGNGGRFWKVSMLSKQEQVYFDKGWASFVADNELKDGEFLTFVFDGYNRYEVSIYGHGGCREIRAAIEVEDISDGSESDNSEGDTHESAIQVEEISDGTVSDTSGGDTHDNPIQVEEINDDETDNESEYSPDRPDLTSISDEGADVVANTTMSIRQRVMKTIENPEAYLDNPNNIHFVTGLKARTYELLINGQFVKDYDLRFANRVDYIDRFGTLTSKTTKWADKRVCVKQWNKICDRNSITKEDSILCEFIRTSNVVSAIKIHLIRNGVKRA